MGTKLDLNYQNKERIVEPLGFEEEQYFVDNAFEVLKQLAPDHRIATYKNLETISSRFIHKGYLIKGLTIEDFTHPSIKIEKEFKNFDLNPLDFLKNKYFDKNASMRHIIKAYLIGKEVEDPGKAISVARIPKTIRKGRFRIINHLDERGEESEKVREKYLKNILEYGDALFEDFSKKDLDYMARKIARNTPTEFNPSPTEFYSRPRGSMFRR